MGSAAALLCLLAAPLRAESAGAPLGSLRKLEILGERLKAASSQEQASEVLAQETDGSRLHPAKGAVTVIAAPVLDAAYRLNHLLSPHRPFTRPVERVDPRPLHVQAEAMRQDIRRHFLVDRGRLFLYQKPMSIGDMAIWQGAYAATTVLQHRMEESERSLAEAEAAFDGLAMMYRPGLPLVRGVLPDSVHIPDAGQRHDAREGGYLRREDASIDQASGWLFGVLMAERYVPTRRGQAQVLLRRFADDLIANGFRLKNSDGTNTKFSDMGGGLISPMPGTLLSLAALSAAAQTSPDPKYWRALREFTDKRQAIWGAYASAPTLWRNSTTNHNIGFLGLACAMLADQDTERWGHFASGLARLAGSVEHTGNSFWLYLSYWLLDRRPEMTAFHAGNPVLSGWLSRRAEVLALAGKSMREFDYPRSKQGFEKINSIRTDLEFVKWPISGTRTIPQPLPVWQRPAADFIWQRSQYSLDDHHGARAKPAVVFTGMDFRLAYLLGVEVGGIDPGE